MSPGAAQEDPEPWIPAQRRERNLQGKQEELLGRDECPAPCAQEVHQVALTEKDTMSQDNRMELPGDFAFCRCCSAWHL